MAPDTVMSGAIVAYPILVISVSHPSPSPRQARTLDIYFSGLALIGQPQALDSLALKGGLRLVIRNGLHHAVD